MSDAAAPRSEVVPSAVSNVAAQRPASAIEFAAAARVVSAAARRAGLVVPGFRTPPRLVGVDRTVRRRGTAATIAVRVRDRPWPAVVADMIDGVITVNRLDARRANRARADLWEAVHRANGTARDDSRSTPARRVA